MQAPQEFQADYLARLVPALQQENLALRVELAYRDKLLAERDADKENPAE